MIVLTVVLASKDEDTDVMLGGGADDVNDAVEEIEMAGMILLLTDMAGAGATREKR